MKHDKLLNFFITNSELSYPVLFDVCQYIDCCSKLPEGFVPETISNLYLITLDMSLKQADHSNTEQLFRGWLKFLLKFHKTPFECDVLSKIPINISLAGFVEKYWNTSSVNSPDLYFNIPDAVKESVDWQLLNFSRNDQYEPCLPNNINKAFPNGIDDYGLQTIFNIFKKHYFEGEYDKALLLLNHFPKDWKTFWNAHLCDPKCNDYIDGLLYLLKKDQGIMEFQNVFTIQLELKRISNLINGKLANSENIDKEIVEQISDELKNEIDIGCSDEDLVDKFTIKLYEKLIFNDALRIFNTLPRNILKAHKLAIYIDLKNIFEFCEDNGLSDVEPILSKINKYLFNEVRDSSSGVSLIIQMLKNNNYRGLSGYISKLSYLLEPDSIDMEILFESLISFVANNKFEKKQYKNFKETFGNLHLSQFKIISLMLDLFYDDNSSILPLTEAIGNNLSVFSSHSQTFYIMIDAIINANARFDMSVHQTFVYGLLKSNISNGQIRSLLYVLVEHFFDQPYKDFTKGFNKAGIEKDKVKRLNTCMENLIDDYFVDEIAAEEYEYKFDAIQKCREFILYFEKEFNNGVFNEYEKQSF